MMQRFNNRFQYIAGLCFAFLLLLFLDRVFLWQDDKTISKIAALSEIVVNFVILVPTFKIYKMMNHENRNIFIWFVITAIGILIGDVSWYWLIYLNNPDMIHLKLVNVIISIIPFYIWNISLTMFFFNVLNKHVLRVKYRLNVFLVFAVINCIIIALFMLSIHNTGGITVMQISSPIIQIILTDFVILCLIYAERSGFVLFLSGYIISIAGNFFCIYATIAQTSILLSYGELLYLCGLLFNWCGVHKIYNDHDYEIKHWVKQDGAIKNKLAFWCFGVGITSFLMFFAIAYLFSVISKEVFLGLPLFIMIYSVVIVIFSLYMGRYFETPFKQLANNIELLLNDNANSQIDNNFSTDEFIFLQQFIVNAFKDKAEKDRIQAKAQKQAEIAEQLKQMAHDMASPIQSINTIIGHVSGSIPEQYRVTLRNASERISGIAQKLISKYSSDGTDDDEVLLVSLAVMQLINEKREEYINSNIKLVVNIDNDANFACIQMSSSVFKRMLSNLINNAFDAVQADSRRTDDGQIMIDLDAFPDKVGLFIDDNGPGMPKHIQEKFMAGIAVTEGKGKAGHGHGLTQAKEAVDKASGELSITAGVEVGTMIRIHFPRVETPGWLATEIKLTCDDTVLILDDDDSIHGAWDSTFEPILAKVPSLKIEHFWQGQEVIDYIEQLSKDAQENTFLLTDYELLDQNVTGLDVVAQSGMTRAVLVTSYATSSKRQQEVVQLGIRMLPKELSAAVKISVDKKIAKGSRKVDMVWLEDKKEYLSETVANCYSHLTVAQYNDPLSLLEDIEQYPLNTRIILDTYYGAGYLDDGLSMASKLHNMGFTKLILYTGEGEIEGAPDYLTVVSKVGHRHIGDQTLDKIAL